MKMDLNYYLSWAEFTVKLIAMLSLTIVISKKILDDKKEYGKFSPIKLIYLMIFATNLFSTFFDDLFYRIGLFKYEWQVEISRIGINTILNGFMVALGFMLIFTILNWKSLQLSSFFFYIGMVLFWLFTGRDDMYFIYTVVLSSISLIVIFAIGIKLKDNGAVGYSTFFLLLLIGYIMVAIPGINDVGGINVGHFFNMGAYGFGIIFALDKFKPFKPKEEFGEKPTNEIIEVVE